MSIRDTEAQRRAYALMRAGRNGEALAFAREAVAGLTRCAMPYGLLATILLNLGRNAEAVAVIEAAARLADAEPAACDALAFASLRAGRPVQASQLYRRATTLAPDVAGYWYNLAASERGLGLLDAAEAACNAAIAADGAHYPSYLLRAELRTQTFDANHVDELSGMLEGMTADAPARVMLGYALAKELDDLGDYDAAFRSFAEAAAVRRRHLAYDVADDERKLARIAEVFDQYTPVTRRRARARFLFIVGLPRSGTTLLERMMSNLPGVVSNGETDNFARALVGAAPAGPGDVFARAARADPGAVARDYARLASRGGSDTVIEKLPMNYLYLGAIRRALPDAAILVMRRPPLESCFAMLRILFGDAYSFSYDIEDLARYYAAYARLMDHWRRTLGSSLHEVSYADLVTEPDRTGVGAAEHCGLPWEKAAVAIENNRAASFTASATQVRQPIYRTSLDRLDYYRRHLEPLVAALRRHGIDEAGDPS